MSFCSIIQSSGMGKSRLVDEFSKNHFLIPINLREEGSQGFPPADVAVRKFLTQFDKKDKNMQEKSYSRACHFLLKLFIHTKDTITTLGADNKKDRIVKFRDFMSEGQKFDEVGKKRKNFYARVVKLARKAMDDRVDAPSEDELLGAFERLRECVCDGASLKGERPLADVFISFDEAHPLAIPWDHNSELSNYIQFQRALHLFSDASLFAFFVPTNGKISQFVPPRPRGPSNRILDPSNRTLHANLRTPRPFIELGFDQLMWNRKILDEYNTLEQVTSSECIAHMGRPLWGTMYDHGDNKFRRNLLSFRYAVLSQRLALDTNTTAYILPTLSDAEVTLGQITNHLRVCVEIGEGMESIRSIAASEPILSEAASYVMRRRGFDLADALSDVLTGFSIHSGDCGELLVAAFFTWARDAVMVERSPRPPEFCRHFSVEELFSCLFSEEIVQSMFNHRPSISSSKAKQRTFREVARSANMHFNHFIQSQEQKFISCRYLIAFIARGAAVLSANCQPDFDAVFPYLYGSTDLDDKNVGFIIVQVKTDCKFSRPNAKLFRKIDPFEWGLLDKSDLDKSSGRFPIPIVRIVFALRGKQTTVTPMSYSSSSKGASSSSFDKHGEPRFTSYDYWCSGIGPGLLQPAEGAHEKWKGVLDLPDQCSHNEFHLNRWLSDSWISGRP
ncbi:hypothetical protein BJV78DRAFT_235120 [Lactifluus subvellereus]|nr:hypothetical protein BJV78DRAFT_235120 [Lactifluus subvellereus]